MPINEPPLALADYVYADNFLLTSLLAMSAFNAKGWPPVSWGTGIHIANFIQPYLGLVLTGKKKVDSRLHRDPKPPYNVLKVGDVLLLKEADGSIVAWCIVAKVECFELDDAGWARVVAVKDKICGTKEYWLAKANSKYATLIWLGEVTRLEVPIPYPLPAEDSWAVVRAKEGAE